VDSPGWERAPWNGQQCYHSYEVCISFRLAPLTSAGANLPIGAKPQIAAEGRLIDLTDYAGQTLKVDLVANSSALYENQIGFYAVEDVSGSIKLALNDG
jgi:hypothetical protein